LAIDHQRAFIQNDLSLRDAAGCLSRTMNMEFSKTIRHSFTPQP